jgi:hypothetical protein
VSGGGVMALVILALVILACYLASVAFSFWAAGRWYRRRDGYGPGGRNRP